MWLRLCTTILFLINIQFNATRYERATSTIRRSLKTNSVTLCNHWWKYKIKQTSVTEILRNTVAELWRSRSNLSLLLKGYNWMTDVDYHDNELSIFSSTVSSIYFFNWVASDNALQCVRLSHTYTHVRVAPLPKLRGGTGVDLICSR